MKKALKRIAAINDISVYGKCSLTVVIPTLSSMGFEVCPIVTSYLSAHTGFESPVIVNLGDNISEVIDYLYKIKVEFDCVFSGYIPTVSQMETVKQFIIKNKTEKKPVVIDPVLGDDGILYKTFDRTHVKKMREMCLYADVITPNYTEACLLANYNYSDSVTEDDLKKIIFKLNAYGITNKIVITSVPFYDGSMKIAISEYGELDIVDCEYVKGIFCGAGDLFASVLTGELLNGFDILTSTKKAGTFVTKVIKETAKNGLSWEDGLMFEKFLEKEI